MDPNLRRNCTCLHAIKNLQILGSALVAACHHQYRFWNCIVLTISPTLKLSITISYRKILAPQKEKGFRGIDARLCGKSPLCFPGARSYGIKTARNILKSYLLRKHRERRSKFWFGVLPIFNCSTKVWYSCYVMCIMYCVYMPCREQVLSKIIFSMCEVTARTLSFATQKSGAYALCTLHVGVSLVTMSHCRKFWGNHAYFFNG